LRGLMHFAPLHELSSSNQDEKDSCRALGERLSKPTPQFGIVLTACRVVHGHIDYAQR
jgi:hypothetical protein